MSQTQSNGTCVIQNCLSMGVHPKGFTSIQCAMGVSSLLIELCESPYISSISSKCFRAGLVRDKLLIANLLADYQQLSADNRPTVVLAAARAPGFCTYRHCEQTMPRYS